MCREGGEGKVEGRLDKIIGAAGPDKISSSGLWRGKVEVGGRWRGSWIR